MDDLFDKFLVAADYQIKESDNYELPMYPNARYLCASDDTGFGALGIHFNGETREVYEIIANTEGKWTADHVAYRWMHPDYREAARLFYAKSGDPDRFCDLTYIDLDVAEDALEKGSEIMRGNVEYDRRITIELDVTEEEAELFRRAAEIRGITLDQFVEEALIQVINETDPVTAQQFRDEGLGDPKGK